MPCWPAGTLHLRLLDGRLFFFGAGGRLPIRHGVGGFRFNPHPRSRSSFFGITILRKLPPTETLGFASAAAVETRDGATPARRRLWGAATDAGGVGRNETQVGTDRPQCQAEADAGMGHRGEAAAIQAQTVACWVEVEACPHSRCAAWWPTNYRRVRDEARTIGERSRWLGGWQRGGASG